MPNLIIEVKDREFMDYQSSGVNIDAGNRAVSLIKEHVLKTHHSGVLSGLGGFAAPVVLPSGYAEPVLVSCTDGVGTKLKIAIELGVLDTIGIDLVAMCVNDLICMGAKPLFFLDYIACNQLVPEQMVDLIKGMTEGCVQSNCALVGGEMAEMGDVYQVGEFDLAGFCVGIVERSKIINGSAIRPGHYVYGIPSSGVHSNGFSLVRSVLTPDVCHHHGIAYDSLLTPTRIYVSLLHTILETHSLSGVAHITGGGIAENIQRILPDDCSLPLQANWDIPTVFKQIQMIGRVDIAEMRRVFNLGIGLVCISPTPLNHPECINMGQIEPGQQGVYWV